MIRPNIGQILIEEETQERVTDSGIVIAETAVLDKPQRGKIIAIGKPKKDDEIDFKVGDWVIFKKWGGNEYSKDKKNYLFVSYDDILGIEE